MYRRYPESKIEAHGSLCLRDDGKIRAPGTHLCVDSGDGRNEVAVVSASGLSLGEIKHTHPILGELDLYQWLIFVGQHEGRHKKQIERTLKSIPA
jgi:hypothetical protein